MGMSDISWGAVLIGAAAAVAIVAMSGSFVAPFGFLNSLTALKAGWVGYTAAGAVGGIAGEFLSDLLGRTGEAVTTIARG